MQSDMTIETHPFEPFLPADACLLMLGTFPPAEKRWCMPFYYPNYLNDMWRIFGICFFGDKSHFVIGEEKRFDLDAIVPFLRSKGIALFDTAQKVCRTKNTASDKDLEIIEPSDLDGMLEPASVPCRDYGRAVGYGYFLFTLRHRSSKGWRVCRF